MLVYLLENATFTSASLEQIDKKNHLIHLCLLDFQSLPAVSGRLGISDRLVDECLKVKLKLVDFKLEFGRYKDQVILADEISPDTCRLWDLETNEKLDKDRFRRDLGNVADAYKEILGRLVGGK